MSESAIDWIKRHKDIYILPESSAKSDVRSVQFGSSFALVFDQSRWNCVAINLDTAEDCEALCRLLRITPEVLS